MWARAEGWHRGLGDWPHGLKFAKALGRTWCSSDVGWKNRRCQAAWRGRSDHFEDAAEMQKHANTFHFILDTVSGDHDLNAYLQLLSWTETMTLVGAPESLRRSASNLLMGRKRSAGSAIGGIRESRKCWISAAANQSRVRRGSDSDTEDQQRL